MLRTLLRPTLRRLVCAGALICAAAALMLWPQQSMQAAREGLSLCAQTIVPSLFPFFVLSGMVVELGMAGYLGRLLERVMWPVFRVGGAGATALVLGFVGGYPVGARTAIELYQKGVCSRTETERLLAFCNNSGPAFILGVVGAGVFGSGRVGLVLYLTHIAASLCVGMIFRFYGRTEARGGRGVSQSVKTVRFSTAFTDSVRAALSGVLNICAFVVVFAVVIRLLNLAGVVELVARVPTALGMDVGQAQQLLRGLLEVTSGVSALEGDGRLTIAAFMLGWAGMSVHCQVLCFLSDSGLRAGTYLAGKALHGVLSALFAAGAGRVLQGALPASGWLGQQVEQVTGLGFTGMFALAVSAAWLLWLGFLAVVIIGARKAKKGVEKGREMRYNKVNLSQEGTLCPNCFKRKSTRAVPTAPGVVTSTTSRWSAPKRA